MKPKTRIQQEVARLSKRLPRLTEEQKAYAFRHCFKHYAVKRADGTNICTECGHSWKSDHDLADTVCECTCPRCGMELEALRTRKSVFRDMEYFSIVITCKQYRIIRFSLSSPDTRQDSQPSIPSLKWCRGGLPPDGKTTIIARLHGISLFYYDLWNECSDIEIRRNGEIRAYDIGSVCTYPRKRFIPKLKYNGFNGNYYNLLPYDFLKAILSDSRAETMLKAEQYPMLHHYIRNSFDIGQY